MKISKSFKIYIHIFAIFFSAQQLLSETNYSKNIVVHKEPIDIKELKFKDFNLNDVDLTNKKGNIMILNFWATWCVPCKKEMPSLDKLKQNKKFKNLEVFAVNIEESKNVNIKTFFEDLNIKELSIFFDKDLNLVNEFKLRGVPTTILINKNGEEFERIIGSIDFEDKFFLQGLSKYD